MKLDHVITAEKSLKMLKYKHCTWYIYSGLVNVGLKNSAVICLTVSVSHFYSSKPLLPYLLNRTHTCSIWDDCEGLSEAMDMKVTPSPEVNQMLVI